MIWGTYMNFIAQYIFHEKKIRMEPFFGQRGSSLMLWGNGNSGNTYKVSIPQYISMKISDETLLFVGGAFAYALGMRNNELHNNAIFFDKHPDGNLFFSRRDFSLMLCGRIANTGHLCSGTEKRQAGRPPAFAGAYLKTSSMKKIQNRRVRRYGD